MTNLFGALDIEILDLIEICLPAVLLAGCLKFEISEALKSRDIISKNYPSSECCSVKFYKRVYG
jgi:hypothetical protein